MILMCFILRRRVANNNESVGFTLHDRNKKACDLICEDGVVALDHDYYCYFVSVRLVRMSI
jgi:hypothetical protein